MEDNQAFVICIQTTIGQCYLGHRDAVVFKIRAAVMYHDNSYATSELDRIIKKHKNTDIIFFNDKEKLSIQPVEINFI